MRKLSFEEPCTECGDQLKSKYITQEFERGGVKIKLSGISAAF